MTNLLNKFPRNSLPTQYRTLQAVDDGLLQLPLGDLECETDAEGSCVIGVIGSNHDNSLPVGSRSGLKIRLQNEKKEQECRR